MTYLNIFVTAIFLALISVNPTLAAAPAVAGSFIIKRKMTFFSMAKCKPQSQVHCTTQPNNDASSAATAAAIHSKAHTSTVKRYNRLLPGLELIKVNPGASTASAVAVYQTEPSIQFIEANWIIHGTSLEPDDPFFKSQWSLRNNGQFGGTLGVDLGALSAWDITLGSPAAVVGVIDTGADYNHPDLKKNIWVNAQEIPGNNLDDDKNGYIDDVHGVNVITHTGDPMDDNEHGTHVAGIIGAEANNGFGISGISPNVTIIPCKFLDASGSGDTASALACLEYFAILATRTKDPISFVATNNSWSGGDTMLALQEAVEAHRDLGILFIAAASNDSLNNDTTVSVPANIPASNVVTVAASDPKDGIATFSNYGKRSVHVAAPGVAIFSTVLGDDYGFLDGTSMAAPYVTGLAALLKASDPTLDWISIKNLIISSGQPTVAAKEKTISGRRIKARDINGLGALSCNNQIVTARLAPKSDSLRMRVGESLSLSTLKINCAKSAQVGLPPSTGLLNDLGTGADAVAYDGVFNGVFKPTVPATYNLIFPGNDIVAVTVTE
ncbi:MAG: S8 family peptidase [Myxococcota bacterium]